MRLSTQSFYQQSTSAVLTQQSNLLKIQQQLGAGSKIVNPSDDPLGATKAVSISQSLALTSQYSTNRSQASQLLSLEDNALQQIATSLQNVKGLVVQASTGTLSDADRQSIATTLQGEYDQLQTLANSDDGNGARLFGGFKTGTSPFVADASGNLNYVGDQGQRMLQVDSSRQLTVTDDGRSVFQTVSRAAGYVTSAATANTGTVVIGAASIVDSQNAQYGSDFTITFNSGSAYTVTTKDTPPVTVASGTYDPAQASQTLSFGGVSVSMSGTPAAGDTLDVSGASHAGTDMFSTLKQLITALRTPVDNGTPAAKAALQNVVGSSNTKMTNALDNILTVRSGVGSKMAELDALDSTGSAKTLADKAQLSSVKDLDYTATISMFYQRQTALQATQKVFVQIQSTSLMDYLK